jgi:undecaprenyl-diphosphatase
VVGGLAFAAIWLAVLGFFYLRRPAEPIDPRLLIGITASTLLIAATINMVLHHAAEVELYKPRSIGASVEQVIGALGGNNAGSAT